MNLNPLYPIDSLPKVQDYLCPKVLGHVLRKQMVNMPPFVNWGTLDLADILLNVQNHLTGEIFPVYPMLSLEVAEFSSREWQCPYENTGLVSG